MKRTWSRLLAMLMTLSLLLSLLPGAMAEEGDAVTPGPEDYAFSNGTITGLKKEYVSRLAARQQVILEIPTEIGGVAVTKIGVRAFQKSDYSGIRFISVSFPQEGSLTEIGSHAFYSNTDLSGDLILPDSLEKLGDNAFNGCTGLKGALTLPQNEAFTSILSQTFMYCPFTGRLTIPNSVTSIGSNAFKLNQGSVGFAGELVVPDSVTLMDSAAFSGQGGLTSLHLSANIVNLDGGQFRYCKGLESVTVSPNSKLKLIKSSAFNEAGTDAVAYLPSGVELGDNAFYYSGFKTVYLGKGSRVTAKTAFSGCSRLTALVCADAEDFAARDTSINNADKFCYPVMIEFDDGAGGEYPVLERLYNRPLNYQKSLDGSWGANGGYTLPTVSDGYSGWAFAKTALLKVSGSTKVTGSTLYPIKAPEDPVITFGPDIDKVYDGTPSNLSVEATHPLYKQIDDADTGDVVFYYTWEWATIGASPAALAGFDENVYDVGDVREDFVITCMVTVQACVVEGTKAVPFYTVKHDFGVKLLQGTPMVSPIYPKGAIALSGGLPELSATSSVPGKTTWDANQTLKEGIESYKWTFTPTDTTNYKMVNGSIVLRAVKGSVYTVTATGDGHGIFLPGASLGVPEGENQVFYVQPEVGYKLDRLLLDGVDVTEQVKNGVYTLADVRAEHAITATFAEMAADDAEKAVEALPVLSEEATPEQAFSILEAKRQSESLSGDQGNAISADAQAKLNDALAAIPGVSVNAAAVTPDSARALLSNMSAEEAQLMQEAEHFAFEVAVAVEEAQPSEQEVEVIQAAMGSGTLCAATAITVTKTLTTDSATHSQSLAELAQPIKLVLQVPEGLPMAGGNRSFTVVRVHDGDAVLLPDEDSDPNTVTVTTDRFSLYALAYQDLPVSSGNSVPSRPSVKAEAGGTAKLSADGKSLMIMPDEGYRVLDVTVNGVSKGAVTTLAGLRAGDRVVVKFERIPAEILPYTDVSEADWYYDAVLYVTEQKLFSGVSDTSFGPSDTMSREMLATVLYRSAGSPESSGMALGEFSDGAQVSDWAAPAMRWAVRQGILTGSDAGVLDPQGAVTRQQIALILYRRAGSPDVGGNALNEFADGGETADWAQGAMLWAVEQGVIGGQPGGILNPGGTASRAEVAVILQRHLPRK